jgi:8-oxo-dGTP pyrophosphatase MutT (NUDIX family)
MSKEDELVDLVDSSGTIKKEKILRSENDNITGLHLQIVIGVIFHSNGKVLVHKRSKDKTVNPGDIDHVCGAIMSGETPERALIRESLEETGIAPDEIKIIDQGVNRYNRYRYLLAGRSNDRPVLLNKDEVEWVDFIHPDELMRKQKSGEFTFVDEFFEEMSRAIENH